MQRSINGHLRSVSHKVAELQDCLPKLPTPAKAVKEVAGAEQRGVEEGWNWAGMGRSGLGIG